jgi:hypothetical protein
MRALVSSSALAVNFFDPWRGETLADLGAALSLNAPVMSLYFEYKPSNYPVKPRSPNLDLRLTLATMVQRVPAGWLNVLIRPCVERLDLR